MGKDKARQSSGQKISAIRRDLTRSSLLGMDFKMAYYKLYRKLAKMALVLISGRHCYRCGKPVYDDDWQIDHTSEWRVANSPIEDFLDIYKTALSHSKCNMAHGARIGGHKRAENFKKINRKKGT